MEFMQTVAFLGVGFMGLVVLGIALVALRRGGSDNPVLVYAMLRRQGDHAARLATASGGRDFALAVEQCLRCSASERCRDWLDSGKLRGYETFCGNAGYVARIRSLTTKWT